MKSIFMWWDRNFNKQFQEQLSNALYEIIRLGEDFSDRFDVRILGNFFFNNRKYGNADWYFDSSFDSRRNQVNAFSVLDKCAGEYWPSQNPNIHIIGTSYDLWKGTSDNTFVFGLTRRSFATIISYNRMVEWYRSNASLVYLILALHEIAHLFEAPDATRRRDLDDALGPHCKLTDCALGQVNVEGRPDAFTATRNILKRHRRTGNYFCKKCTTDIVRGKRKLS